MHMYMHMRMRLKCTCVSNAHASQMHMHIRMRMRMHRCVANFLSGASRTKGLVSPAAARFLRAGELEEAEQGATKAEQGRGAKAERGGTRATQAGGATSTATTMPSASARRAAPESDGAPTGGKQEGKQEGKQVSWGVLRRAVRAGAHFHHEDEYVALRKELHTIGMYRCFVSVVSFPPADLRNSHDDLDRIASEFKQAMLDNTLGHVWADCGLIAG